MFQTSREHFFNHRCVSLVRHIPFFHHILIESIAFFVFLVVDPFQNRFRFIQLAKMEVCGCTSIYGFFWNVFVAIGEVEHVQCLFISPFFDQTGCQIHGNGFQQLLQILRTRILDVHLPLFQRVEWQTRDQQLCRSTEVLVRE